MKVKELIYLLSLENPEAEVITWDNNNELPTGPINDYLMKGYSYTYPKFIEEFGPGARNYKLGMPSADPDLIDPQIVVVIK